MEVYQGISRQKYPLWKGWEYIALYSSITDDFNNDKPLQRLVNKHYFKQKLLITLYNLSIYGFLYGISILIKG